MDERLRCPLCGHEQCDECLEDHGKSGLWVNCSRCGFGSLVSLWAPQNYDNVEVVVTGSATCEYCGHVRCENCEPDQWRNLDDGCCAYRRRVLSSSP